MPPTCHPNSNKFSLHQTTKTFRPPAPLLYRSSFGGLAAQYYNIANPFFHSHMKTKPLINDNNLPKSHPKQPLFIVRPKPSQGRLQPPTPTLTLTREQPTPTSSQSPCKSIDDCLASLEGQLTEELTMPRGICLRVKEHLLALRLRYTSEQQSYNDNRHEMDPPSSSMVLLRKPSTRFFKSQRTEACDDPRNKENLLSTDNCSTTKLAKTKSKKDDNQIQIHTLETKLKAMSERMQEYERDYRSFEERVEKLEGELALALKGKEQLKGMFEEESRVKSETEGQLRKSLRDIEERHGRLQKQYRQTFLCLQQREREIITLWQLLSK